LLRQIMSNQTPIDLPPAEKTIDNNIFEPEIPLIEAQAPSPLQQRIMNYQRMMAENPEGLGDVIEESRYGDWWKSERVPETYFDERLESISPESVPDWLERTPPGTGHRKVDF
ncbi:MAG: globin family protein, partial [Planctomycetota bacterium]